MRQSISSIAEAWSPDEITASSAAYLTALSSGSRENVLIDLWDANEVTFDNRAKTLTLAELLVFLDTGLIPNSHTTISGGATASLDVEAFQFAEVALDQSMVLTITGSLGRAGGMTVQQGGAGNWGLSLSGATLIGKLKKGPGEVTQFDLRTNADGSVSAVSQLVPSEGMDDLGSLGGAQTVNFEFGDSDFKKITMSSALTLTLSAERKTEFKLMLVQGAGAYGVTWPASLNGNPPQPDTVDGSKSLYRFVCDGTELHY